MARLQVVVLQRPNLLIFMIIFYIIVKTILQESNSVFTPRIHKNILMIGLSTQMKMGVGINVAKGEKMEMEMQFGKNNI